ncbi:MAG TPA: PH domain-containing protein [Marmoricola sp.]|nr:PH domain-containing protein [Marmoricola sp.]
MATKRKRLGEGEEIVFSTRTHVKVLVVPALVLLLAALLAGFLTSLTDDTTLLWVIWIAAAALVLAFSVWPFLEWLTATYTVTNRRLTTHRGVINRTGHDIPLSRISDVTYEKGLTDRMLGCGTLRVSDASDQGAIELPDVPRVEELQLLLSEQLYAGRDDRRDDRRDDGA